MEANTRDRHSLEWGVPKLNRDVSAIVFRELGIASRAF